MASHEMIEAMVDAIKVQGEGLNGHSVSIAELTAQIHGIGLAMTFMRTVVQDFVGRAAYAAKAEDFLAVADRMSTAKPSPGMTTAVAMLRSLITQT